MVLSVIGLVIKHRMPSSYCLNLCICYKSVYKVRAASIFILDFDTNPSNGPCLIIKQGQKLSIIT